MTLGANDDVICEPPLTHQMSPIELKTSCNMHCFPMLKSLPTKCPLWKWKCSVHTCLLSKINEQLLPTFCTLTTTCIFFSRWRHYCEARQRRREREREREKKKKRERETVFPSTAMHRNEVTNQTFPRISRFCQIIPYLWFVTDVYRETHWCLDVYVFIYRHL